MSKKVFPNYKQIRNKLFIALNIKQTMEFFFFYPRGSFKTLNDYTVSDRNDLKRQCMRENVKCGKC